MQIAMHRIIFYGSYLVFPFVIILTYIAWEKYNKICQSKILIILIGLLFILSVLFIYARFIEPQLIVIKTHKIDIGFDAKIVVLADIHLGVYKNEKFLERIVEKVNKMENIDAVLIPGDLTFEPNQPLDGLFKSLADLKFTTYAVLGNHDTEHPGPPIRDELEIALKKHGVIFMNNDAAIIPNTNITLLGLGDNWAHEDDISLIENYSEKDNLIVMTHNPDTTLNYANPIPDITIAGHSHAGQIRLPIIYKYAIPCTGDFDKDLHETPTGKVFVSPGLGETGLPLRFSMPPTIDVIEFY